MKRVGLYFDTSIDMPESPCPALLNLQAIEKVFRKPHGQSHVMPEKPAQEALLIVACRKLFDAGQIVFLVLHHDQRERPAFRLYQPGQNIPRQPGKSDRRMQ